MTAQPPLSLLTLRHVIPHPLAIEQWAEVRPLIDGRDVLRKIHPQGMSSCCRRELAGPAEGRPLTATEEPREVELSNNDCVTGCCGGVFVTIHRQGDRVIWSSWRNTDDIRAPVPADIHFDAAQYDAELARAAADHDWEEPVDTVARLLTQAFTDSGWFARWNCLLESVDPRREEPEAVEVYFRAADDPRGCTAGYAYELPVTRHEPAEEQARRFVARIRAGLPSCGMRGSESVGALPGEARGSTCSCVPAPARRPLGPWGGHDAPGRDPRSKQQRTNSCTTASVSSVRAHATPTSLGPTPLTGRYVMPGRA